MSLLDEDVGKIAEKVFDGQGLRVLGHELQKKEKDECQGHLGSYYTLRMVAEEPGKLHRRQFFLKTYNVKEENEDFIGDNGIFLKEVNFYKWIVEDLRKNVGGPHWCPKYIFSKPRVLVLEDLSVDGFRTVGNGTSLDKKHLELALKNLSAMHASTVLLEYQTNNSLPNMYPKFFEEIFYDEKKEDAASRKWIMWQIQDLLVAIDFLDKYSEAEKKEIKNKFTEQILRIFPLSKQSVKYRNVLTHGDLWGNNLLFRYSKEVPTDCRFVDFQFARYAPPAHDVMHLLHYLTTKTIRDKEESHYLKFYYENLRQQFAAGNRDVEKELTWSDFLESCREYKELALIQTLLTMHYILGPVTLNVEIGSYDSYEDYLAKNRNEYMKTFFKKESYVNKIKDILHEIIDKYMIKS